MSTAAHVQPNDKELSFKDGMSIEETYTKMEQHEHILLRPDMYIGSTRRITDDLWVWDDQQQGMVLRSVTYAPGLYKIFDEVLVNAADNAQRDSTMRFIKVHIDVERGSISVHNDGHGIPVEKHKIHDKYVPELIFGDLLTGSNFDDAQAKVTGGRNGLGAKLANIYSHEFVVETCCDHKMFKQTFHDNMRTRDAPIVKSAPKFHDYTKITFTPDLKRFDDMQQLDSDIVALFKKRVVDIAGCNSKLQVWLNDEKLPIRSFKDYVGLYFKSRSDESKPVIIGPDVIVDATGKRRWEVVFTVSHGDFQQVSFVNSIWTMRGGNHVQAVIKKIVDQLQPKIKKKNKGTEVKHAMMRNHMFIFVNALINNPEFDSQTKETLKSTQMQWGTKCDLSESFLTNVVNKSGIIERILLWNQGRSAIALKVTNGKKRGRLGISKLTEANQAATSKSHRCTLIITEGDSAKGLALAGLSVVGRDYYGIFPLRGKVLNVRDAAMSQVLKNEELNMIKKAMGLQHDKVYTDVSSLRYGKIMIMTDQDHDGSHIKGLFINFIHHYWPSLIKIPGFLTEFITPIVKVTNKNVTHSFFTIPEYRAWCDTHAQELHKPKIKYYKGLGTSEPAEMQEYFGDLAKHKKDFVYTNDQDDKAIELAFSKSNSDQRKSWLADFEPGTHLDQSLTHIPYHEFINKELILFSLEDCERSIASMMDGLKPGQRKIMFACFKRNLRGEIKIAQLAGYVLEHCAYHHGETSLYTTMINMAQNFVGSNNINVLEPVGNFGSRDQGGKDAAAARYIFTTLSVMARYIFHPDDDQILNYLEDEGLSIQPDFYAPVVPMVLINGNAGIGTGWSSFVPNYNPRDIVHNLKRLLNNEAWVEMHPWYRGFQGTITWNSVSKNYRVTGRWRRLNDESIEITELPIGTWTQTYKEFLEKIVVASDEHVKKQKLSSSKKSSEKNENHEKVDKDDKEDEDEAYDAKPKPKKKTTKVKVKLEENGDEDDAATTTSKNNDPAIHLKDFKEYHTTSQVHFVLFGESFKDMTDDMIEKKLKLTDSLSINNMHLFGPDGRIQKYPNPQEILKAFFNVRLDMYEQRKCHIADRMASQLKVLDNKARFIRAVVNKDIIVANRKKVDLFEELRKKNYDPYPKGDVVLKHANVEAHDEEEDEEHDDSQEHDASDTTSNSHTHATSEYDYLLSMPIWSLTAERLQQLLDQAEQKRVEWAAMCKVKGADLWERDLDAFLDAWDRYEYNMTILDQTGVGGSAFRKPSLQSNASTTQGNIEAKKKREANLATFKKLKKLPPHKTLMMIPDVNTERPEIIKPEVITDSIIPAPKVKKERQSVKLRAVTASSPNDTQDVSMMDQLDQDIDDVKPPLIMDAKRSRSKMDDPPTSSTDTMQTTKPKRNSLDDYLTPNKKMKLKDDQS